MTKPLRVVLDSNAFSPDHFQALAKSRFLGLVKSRRLVPVFSAVMMEETLRAYNDRSRSLLLNDWLPFILATQARFCVELPEIWRRELVLRKGAGASEYLSHPRQRSLMQVLGTFPADGSSSLMAKVQPIWHHDDETRKAIRRAILALRKKPVQKAVRPIDETLPQLQMTAARRLLSFVTPHGSVARDLLARWQPAKQSYPFFTQAVDDFVFQLMLPLVDHSAAVDQNARPDLEILIHLVRADALVTNETRFMARAFDEIWKPRGKSRFTSAEFAAFLAHL